MKKSILCLLIIIAAFSLFGQKAENGLHKVILKNGNVSIGTIQNLADGFVEVEIIGGEKLVFPKSTIKEIKPFRNNFQFDSTRKFIKTKGYFNATRIGYGISGMKYEDTPGYDINRTSFTFNIVNGYYLNPHFGLGLGIGWVEQHNGSYIYSYSFIPLTVHIRGMLPHAKKIVYGSLDLGNSIYFKDRFGFSRFSSFLGNRDIDAGWRIRPALGIRIPTRKPVSYSLELLFDFSRRKTSQISHLSQRW